MRLVLIACALLAGCAAPPPPKPAAAPSLREISSSLAVGRSTRSDVRAALGEGTVVNFDSGYEVWVYRQPAVEKPPAAAAELVLLFEPSGILSKMRVR
ncbi:MAG TPA: hypothetical protein VFZ54_08025 [Burkholderiales bacterium]